MPLVRKIIAVGNSRAITIPDEWLKYHEKKLGYRPDTLLMEVNNKITLKIDKRDANGNQSKDRSP